MGDDTQDPSVTGSSWVLMAGGRSRLLKRMIKPGGEFLHFRYCAELSTGGRIVFSLPQITGQLCADRYLGGIKDLDAQDDHAERPLRVCAS